MIIEVCDFCGNRKPEYEFVLTEKRNLFARRVNTKYDICHCCWQRMRIYVKENSRKDGMSNENTGK